MTVVRCSGWSRFRVRPVALVFGQLATAKQKRWEHPYYWAGFVLQGEWR